MHMSPPVHFKPETSNTRTFILLLYLKIYLTFTLGFMNKMFLLYMFCMNCWIKGTLQAPGIELCLLGKQFGLLHTLVGVDCNIELILSYMCIPSWVCHQAYVVMCIPSCVCDPSVYRHVYVVMCMWSSVCGYVYVIKCIPSCVCVCKSMFMC